MSRYQNPSFRIFCTTSFRNNFSLFQLETKTVSYKQLDNQSIPVKWYLQAKPVYFSRFEPGKTNLENM